MTTPSIMPRTIGTRDVVHTPEAALTAELDELVIMTDYIFRAHLRHHDRDTALDLTELTLNWKANS